MEEGIQLNWYRIPENPSKEYQWYFLIIGDKNSINTIRKSLHNKLGPEIRERLFDFGKIKNSKKFYEILCLESKNPEIELLDKDIISKEDERVYNGKWRDLVNFL